MFERTARILTLSALAFFSASTAVAQSPATSVAPANPADNTWQTAQSIGLSKKKLLIVTLDQAQRPQTCRIESFTTDKLVCSHSFRRFRTYTRQQIVALMLPGDGDLRLPLFVAFNVGLGTAIWGTVALAAACPACAVATSIAALIFFGAAGASVYGDDAPYRLVYLAPGQQLTCKLRSVRF